MWNMGFLGCFSFCDFLSDFQCCDRIGSWQVASALSSKDTEIILFNANFFCTYTMHSIDNLCSIYTSELVHNVSEFLSHQPSTPFTLFNTNNTFVGAIMVGAFLLQSGGHICETDFKVNRAVLIVHPKFEKSSKTVRSIFWEIKGYSKKQNCSCAWFILMTAQSRLLKMCFCTVTLSAQSQL